MVAAQQGHINKIQSLLAAHPKPNVDAVNHEGWTALMVAVDNNQLDAVKFLLAAKSNIKVENKEGLSALKLATEKGNVLIMRALEEGLEASRKQAVLSLPNTVFLPTAKPSIGSSIANDVSTNDNRHIAKSKLAKVFGYIWG